MEGAHATVNKTTPFAASAAALGAGPAFANSAKALAGASVVAAVASVETDSLVSMEGIEEAAGPV
eukprot:587106-Pyramimonas_sp.AAC.1